EVQLDFPGLFGAVVPRRIHLVGLMLSPVPHPPFALGKLASRSRGDERDPNGCEPAQTAIRVAPARTHDPTFHRTRPSSTQRVEHPLSTIGRKPHPDTPRLGKLDIPRFGNVRQAPASRSTDLLSQQSCTTSRAPPERCSPRLSGRKKPQCRTTRLKPASSSGHPATGWSAAPSDGGPPTPWRST